MHSLCLFEIDTKRPLTGNDIIELGLCENSKNLSLLLMKVYPRVYHYDVCYVHKLCDDTILSP